MQTAGGGGATEEFGEGLPGLRVTAGKTTSFNYLGWVMTPGGNDWLVVAGKLRKDWKSWMRMMRILGWEGEYPRIYGFVF